MKTEGYRLAFNFEGVSGKNLNDPRYFKTIVRTINFKIEG